MCQDEKERQRLFAEMLQMWHAVDVPENVATLGRLRKFPPPKGLSTMDPAAMEEWEEVVRETTEPLQTLIRRARRHEPMTTALLR